MGRLDDIIERNRRALGAQPFGVRLPAKLDGAAEQPSVPTSPAGESPKSSPMFASVVAPRRSTTPLWKVLPFMLLIAAVIGWRTCSTLEAEQRDQERREQLLRHEHEQR